MYYAMGDASERRCTVDIVKEKMKVDIKEKEVTCHSETLGRVQNPRLS